jgi:uncharacterized delta-60 repeat protein
VNTPSHSAYLALVAFAFFVSVEVTKGQLKDDSFNPNLNGVIHCILPLPNGKVLIGGEFTAFDGVFQRSIARLNADGTRDVTFSVALGNVSGDPPSEVLSMELQSDEKIIICGGFTKISAGLGAPIRNFVARLNTNGSLDESFDAGVSSVDAGVGVVCTAIQSNGQILIGGGFTTVRGENRMYLARVYSDGSLDEDFASPLEGYTINGHPPSGQVNNIIIQDDGKIIIVGSFSIGQNVQRSIVRLNTDGSIDQGYQQYNFVNSVAALRSDGKLIVSFRENATSTRIVCLNSEGAIDSQYGQSPGGSQLNGRILKLAFQANSKLLALGEFTQAEGSVRSLLARFDTNGNLDPGFVPAIFSDPYITTNPYLWTVAIDKDDKCLAGGNFRKYDGVANKYLIRLLMPGPTITGQPTPQYPFFGQQATLSVTAEGEGTLSYQWRKNLQAIPGANSSTLILAKPTYHDSGSYSVIVSDDVGEVTSNTVTLTVRNPLPNVSIDPGSHQVVTVGGTLTFTASAAAGNPPFTFQWRKDGKSILNAKSQTLTLFNLQRTQAGEYDVVVRNSHGVAVSNKVSLSFDPLVVVPGPPATIDRKVGETATFSVNMPGASFQWLKNGKVIPGQNTNTLAFTVSDASAAGWYSVVVTTSAGKVTTDAAQLRVTDDGLLIYKLSATAKAYEGTSSTSATITGFLALDRAGQRGGMIFNAKQGTISAHQIEIHENLDSTSTGPVPRSRTVVSEMEDGELALWISGADSLIKISKTDTTVGPAAMKGFMNSISVGSDLHIEEATLSMLIDAASSAITRETGESLENALLRLSQELQAKGSAFVE